MYAWGNNWVSDNQCGVNRIVLGITLSVSNSYLSFVSRYVPENKPLHLILDHPPHPTCRKCTLELILASSPGLSLLQDKPIPLTPRFGIMILFLSLSERRVIQHQVVLTRLRIFLEQFVNQVCPLNPLLARRLAALLVEPQNPDRELVVLLESGPLPTLIFVSCTQVVSICLLLCVLGSLVRNTYKIIMT